MPRITIGMTAFNSEKIIQNSVESLLSQTCTDFALIISDDASTDGTELVCSRLAARDQRIKYVRQKVNIGPLANFAFTLSQADTEYFMWASHDDLWHTRFIERCIEELEKNADAGFAITQWIVESANLPFVARTHLANMDFVASRAPLDRMLQFTALPLLSFKDNLTYGVWRRKALTRVVSDLAGKIKYFSIGSVANEYSLLLYRGLLIRDVYLRKRYKWVPPGHWLKAVTEFAYGIGLLKKPRSPYPKYTHADHFADLRAVLELAGVEERVIRRAIDLNRLHHFER